MSTVTCNVPPEWLPMLDALAATQGRARASQLHWLIGQGLETYAPDAWAQHVQHVLASREGRTEGVRRERDK